MSLKYVLSILDEIGKTTKMKEKKEIIKKNCDDDLFRKIVVDALDPFKKFNTTRVYFTDRKQDASTLDIFKYLDYLSTKRGVNDSEIQELSKIASKDKETIEVVRRVINKDLKCGASIKTFKEFFPEITDYSVMLCQADLNHFLKRCNNNLNNIYWSVKLNGVRATTTGNGIYLSRNGREYPNFGVFNNEISLLNKALYQLYPDIEWNIVPKDGEVISDAKEHEFQEVMTQIRRLKDVDTSSLLFYVFDIILDDYPLYKRQEMLKSAFEKINNEKVQLLEHYICGDFLTNVEQIKQLANIKVEEGYEGIVLKNIYSYYENKKSPEWCKLKRVETLDCKVTGWEYGTGRLSTVLGKMHCLLSDGTEFKVGSGFSDNQRVELMYNLPNIIEIEYQEKSKYGVPIHPIFKRVREDKDEID